MGTDVSPARMSPWRMTPGSRSLAIGAGYLALYLLLDWASFVEPLPHTSITPWNPNTGVLMALLLARGARWTPLIVLGNFAGKTRSGAQKHGKVVGC